MIIAKLISESDLAEMRSNTKGLSGQHFVDNMSLGKSRNSQHFLMAQLTQDLRI